MRMIGGVVGWVVAATLALPAWGQSGGVAGLPTAWSPWDPRGTARTGHGWVVVPAAGESVAGDGVGGHALMHVPPRAAGSGGTTVRQAARVAEAPEALAAWEGQVWLIFRPDGRGENGQMRRRVASMEVFPSAIAGEYAASGSLGTRASLEQDGELAGAAGTPAGPVVLMRRGDRVEMAVLRGSAWRGVRMPDALVGLASPPGWIGMAPTREGPFLAWIIDGGRYQTALARLTVEDGEGIGVEWEVGAAPAGVPADGDARGAGRDEPRLDTGIERRLAWIDGQVIVVERTDGADVRLVSVRGGAGVVEMGRVVLPEPAGLVARDGMGRLAGVWIGAPVAATGRSVFGVSGGEKWPTFNVVEVSAFTGRVMHEGGVSGKLFAAWQLQALMVLMSVLVVAVLLFVLRSEADTSVPLPEGLVLAPIGRRLAAAAIDFVLPCVLASVVHGVAPSRILAIPLTGRTPEEWWPMATLGLVLLGTTIVQEWRTGRTLGKRLMGLGVVGFRPVRRVVKAGKEGGDEVVGQWVAGRPTLAQATVRNVMRWVAWPTTVLLLVDANRRHPGDVMARTVVAAPRRQEDEGSNEGD